MHLQELECGHCAFEIPFIINTLSSGEPLKTLTRVSVNFVNSKVIYINVKKRKSLFV